MRSRATSETNFAALTEALADIEGRLNYYATNHTPEDLCELLRDAALRVNAVIERLQLVKKVVRHGQDAMKRYEAHGYRVEIEKSLARVYQFLPKGDRQPDWCQVRESPYHLPVLDFELENSPNQLSHAVYIYELTTGRSDLRDAVTRSVT